MTRSGRGLRQELRVLAITTLAGAVQRLLAATHRGRVVGRTHHQRRLEGVPGRCIYSGWHAHLISGMFALAHQDVLPLVSSHRDGEIITRVAERRGFRCIRGSSTRGGARAMRELVRVVRESEGDLLFTVDGPRGPAREIKEGVLFAASVTGLPIVPIGLWAEHAWFAGSWDRHVIAKPFSRVVVAFGDELPIPPDQSREQLLEVWRPRLAAAMEQVEGVAREALSTPSGG